jgi:glycosyltransferase involved in cell wall biosynthesis
LDSALSDEKASAPGCGIVDVTMIIQRLRPMFSGQGVQLEELCRELARRGVRVTILTAGQGRQPRWEAIDGYRVRRLRADIPWLSRRLRPGRFRSEIFALKTLLWLLAHGRRTQIIHVHALTDALHAASLVARLWRRPLLFEMTLLGADDAASFASSPNRLRGLRNAVFRRCDGFVAISPALARVYRDAGLPADRLRLIPQGVDLERFRPSPARRALRRRLGLLEDDPVVVFVGSLIERKGIDTLLAAWSEVHGRLARATLVLVGPNSFPDDAGAEDFLLRHLGRLPAAARRQVREAGVRETVEDYLGAADVFAFPSRREGFGTVMIEAMACAVPCVVAELPEITDFIFGGGRHAPRSGVPATGESGGAPGGTAIGRSDTEAAGGVIVPPDDVFGLARAIIALLEDPERARAIGAAGRRRAEERFALDRIAADYLDFYATLLHARAAT